MKRSQINVRSTAAIDAVLLALMSKLDKSKTDIVHLGLMALAEKELTPAELLECLKQDFN